MPQVIAILNQKGGSGKTTLATNLAHALQRSSRRVLLADADPQGSLRDWRDSSDAPPIPVVGVDRPASVDGLPSLTGGVDVVVIDGAPRIEKLSAACVRVADLVLIPVQPSPYDVWACADVVDLVEARRQVTGGPPLAAFVLSRTAPRTKLAAEAPEVLAQYRLPVLRTSTQQRVLYPTVAATGGTVFTADPSGPAAAEITAITHEVMEALDGFVGQDDPPRIAV